MNSIEQQIIRYLRQYQIIRFAVISRVLRPTLEAQTRIALNQLVMTGLIQRHQCQGETYYSFSSQSFPLGRLRDLSGVAWFTCCHRPPRQLLTHADFRRFSPQMGRVLAFDTCYLYQSSPPNPSQLSLLRVNHHRSIPTMLKYLRALVVHPSFTQWQSFAAAARFVLTYLVTRPDVRDELREALSKTPLIISLRDHYITVPVRIALTHCLADPLS